MHRCIVLPKKHCESFGAIGSKVWDVDGTPGVTSDPRRGRPDERSSGSLHHGGLTFLKTLRGSGIHTVLRFTI